VTEAVRQDSTLRGVASEIFTRDGKGYNKVEGYDTITDIAQNIDKFFERFGVEQIQELQLKLVVHSRLDSIAAKIRLELFDHSYSMLDSFTITIPAGEEIEIPTTCFYGRGDARRFIKSLDKVVFKLSSELMVDDEQFNKIFNKIKDLHDQKVSATVGLMVKMAINDNDAGE
jgi:hypothetical protein